MQAFKEAFQKAIFQVLLALLVLCFCQMAMAQVAPVSTDEFLDFLSKSLGGFKGAGVIGCLLLGFQIIFKFLSTAWADKLVGKYKLLSVIICSFIIAVLVALSIPGISWSAALLSAPVLAALQVLIHQIYVQFLTPKGNS